MAKFQGIPSGSESQQAGGGRSREALDLGLPLALPAQDKDIYLYSHCRWASQEVAGAPGEDLLFHLEILLLVRVFLSLVALGCQCSVPGLMLKLVNATLRTSHSEDHLLPLLAPRCPSVPSTQFSH